MVNKYSSSEFLKQHFYFIIENKIQHFNAVNLF